jgi:hypothetical protein
MSQHRLLLPILGLGCVLSWAGPGRAAAPLSLQVQPEPVLPVPATPPALKPPPGAFQPAPLPNRDVARPGGARAGPGASLGPSLFTRSDTYRGEGFNQGSTAQSEQEKRAKPAAGFSLRMPFTGN